MANGRKTGGRAKGTPNTKNRERIAKAESSGMMPTDFLLAVCRGETFEGYAPTFDQRLDAAKAVAPYYAPKLAAIEHTGANGGAIAHDHRIEIELIRPPHESAVP